MIRKHIPNFITCLNLVSGSLAVIFALNGQLTYAVILILAAAVLDFLDGMAARILKSWSPIGRDLDSLADMISFGLAPGMIIFTLLKYSFTGNEGPPGYLPPDFSLLQELTLITSLLIPVFSALRLAKFNNDTRQISSFIGLPTPANAIFISSLALIHQYGVYPAFDACLLSTASLVVITLLSSYLLVSSIPMFSLKFKNLGWSNNKTRIVFLVLSAFLILTLYSYGIAATIICYILLSVLQNVQKKKQ
jgi:CDP-diacylglycerol---serine O-phosphatidyltransferase